MNMLSKIESALSQFESIGGTVERRLSEDSNLIGNLSDLLSIELPPVFQAFYKKYNFVAYGPEEFLSVDQLIESYDQLQTLTPYARWLLPFVEDESGGYYAVMCGQSEDEDSEFGCIFWVGGSEMEFCNSNLLSFITTRLDLWKEELTLDPNNSRNSTYPDVAPSLPRDIAITLLIAAEDTDQSDFIEVATNHAKHTVGDDLTENQIENCLKRLTSQGLVRLIDVPQQNLIRTTLQKQQCSFPVLGLPKLGCISLTLKGADIVQRHYRKEEYFCSILRSEKTQFVFNQLPAAERAATYLTSNSNISVSKPIKIGLWQCVDFWMPTEGHTIEAEQIYSDYTWTATSSSYVTDFVVKKVVRNSHISEKSPRQVCEIVCLLCLSGLFGYGPLVRQGLNRPFKLLFGSKFNPSDIDQALERLVKKQMIEIASTGHEILAQPLMDPNTLNLLRRPTPGVSFLPTFEGLKYLNENLDYSIFGQSHPEAYGYRQLLSVREFFTDSLVIADRETEKLQAKNGITVRPVVPIGKWCGNWWDVRNEGYKFLYEECLES